MKKINKECIHSYSSGNYCSICGKRLTIKELKNSISLKDKK